MMAAAKDAIKAAFPKFIAAKHSLFTLQWTQLLCDVVRSYAAATTPRRVVEFIGRALSGLFRALEPGGPAGQLVQQSYKDLGDALPHNEVVRLVQQLEWMLASPRTAAAGKAVRALYAKTSLLGIAAFFGHTAAVEAIVAKDGIAAERAGTAESPLTMAVSNKENEAAASLLAMRADPSVQNVHGESVLFSAIFAGCDSGLIAMLLAAGADPNTPRRGDNKTPLYLAVCHEHHAAMKELLAAGADPDVPFFPAGRVELATTTLHHAIMHGCDRMVRMLLQARAGTDIPQAGTGERPLHAAVSGRNAKIVAAILRAAPQGAVNCQEMFGNTPLHLAAATDATAHIAHLLLEGGASPYVRNDSGDTPAHVAAQAGAYRLVQQLVEGHADLAGAPNNAGNTLLHLVAGGLSAGEAPVACLLRGGANIEAVNATGHTPLAVAAGRYGGEGATRALLRCGANPRPPAAKNPFDEALRGMHLDQAALLAVGGARSTLPGDVDGGIRRLALLSWPERVQSEVDYLLDPAVTPFGRAEKYNQLPLYCRIERFGHVSLEEDAIRARIGSRHPAKIVQLVLRGWSPELHGACPPAMRPAVRTLLQIEHRCREDAARGAPAPTYLPPELWRLIARFLDRRAWLRPSP